MKTFNEFTEQQTVADKWAHTGLLVSLSEEQATNCALALESQRIWNELAECPATFKRVSIPVVRRVFGMVENLKGTLHPKDKVQIVSTFKNTNFPANEEALQGEAAMTQTFAEQVAEQIKDNFESGNVFEVGNLIWEDGKIYLSIRK